MTEVQPRLLPDGIDIDQVVDAASARVRARFTDDWAGQNRDLIAEVSSDVVKEVLRELLAASASRPS
jgi:hypothetical protein